MDFISIGLGVIGIAAGAGVGLSYRKSADGKKVKSAEEQAQAILLKAQEHLKTAEHQARNRARNIEQAAQQEAQKDARKRETDGREADRRTKEKETQLDSKLSAAELREKKLQETEARVQQTETKVSETLEQVKSTLEKTSSMSQEEAKKVLVDTMEGEARLDAAKIIRVIEDEAKQEAEKRAKKIISLAITRYAGEYSSERTMSVVALPSEEMKGRIIGREGRNIRALEAATGMDLIIDDTPEAVVISGFDPVRREVARMTLETLMSDGRIHPSRIEEVVDKSKSLIMKTMKDDGEKAMFDLGIHGVHAEIVRLIGSLRYRTSYTQNNYSHSLEVGFLAGIMAGELGINTKSARRAGVLHDLGKALDHNVEGSHAVIGADFAKKYGEAPDIVHAIRAHHEDEKPDTILAQIVQAADALSGARPGARREMMESYVNRLEDLETIGNSFDGVIRTFAIQAGREIRVLVESEKVTDEQSIMLSRDIARKIEREMTYPGQIKVTVVRETRAVEHAR
jgi:ribonuclease Y